MHTWNAAASSNDRREDMWERESVRAYMQNGYSHSAFVAEAGLDP